MSTVLTTLERMLQAGAEVKGFKPDGLTLEAKLRDEEAHGLDSIGRVEFILALEELFGISLDGEQVEELETVADLARYIKAQVAAKVATP